jgi:hypothetical protein
MMNVMKKCWFLRDLGNWLPKYLLILLSLSLCSFADMTADGLHYYNESGKIYIVGYEGAERNVVIPDTIGGVKVTRIDYDAFYGVDIDSLTLGANVSIIKEDAFGGGCKIKEFKVVAGNSSFTTIDGVLFNKSKTHLVAYPGGKTTAHYVMPSTVTGMYEDAVDMCPHLVTFTFSSNFSTFSCDESLDEQNEDCSSFDDCQNLTDFIVPAGNRYFASENGVLFNKAKTELWRYPMGRGDSSYTVPSGVEIIKEEAFCVEMTESPLRGITFPASVAFMEDYAIDSHSIMTLTFLGTQPFSPWFQINEYAVIKALPDKGWPDEVFGYPVRIMYPLTALEIWCNELVNDNIHVPQKPGGGIQCPVLGYSVIPGRQL